VPQFPRKTWSISLRQLAGHLAGIRHYDNGEMYSMKHYPDVLSGLVIFQDDSLLFEPGTRYSYSSYGWNLISAALETASGRPFLELMQHDVFEAAGMDNTLPEFQEPLIPNRARFYDVADDGTVTNAPYVDNSYKWASGGFLSTAGDLVRFGNAMLHGDLVDLDTFRWLTTSQATTDGEETNYGIGWRTNMAALAKHGLRFHDERIAERTEARLQGVLVVGHTGGAIGGKGILLVAPDQDVVVAALTNCNLAPRFALVVLADLVAELSSVPVNSSSSAHD
jgi:CubicO group peptidase (beta-lactamase class C family)